MIAEQIRGAYSAAVDMWLIVDGETIGITHMGADYLLLDSSNEHAAGDAVVVLKIDENERRWTVRLPEGIRVGQKRVQLSN